MCRRTVLGILLATVLAAAGCGGGDSSGGGSSGASTPKGGTLNVFAASSLTEAFTKLADTYQAAHPGWTVRLNFAGSDQLAAQIEQGVPADVFAAASPKYPEELQGKNLLGDTTNFATNTLVVVVPAANPAGIKTVNDLTKGAKLVVADPAVPLGAYTETVLDEPRDLGVRPEYREQGAGREERAGEDHAGRGRRRVRLHHGCPLRGRQGEADHLPQVCRGDGRVSDRDRVEQQAD